MLNGGRNRRELRLLPGRGGSYRKIQRYVSRQIFRVGIHCTEAFSTGVMENPEYADPFVRNLKINSLPSAVLNRSVTTSPSDFNSTDSAVKKILDGRSAARVVIDRVDCDMQTGETCVSFTSEMCASDGSPDKRMCDIVGRQPSRGLPANGFSLIISAECPKKISSRLMYPGGHT